MQGKIMMVTGGTAGIGKATALELARTGAKVISIGRNESKGHQVLEEIEKATGNAKLDFFQADLSSHASIREMVEKYKAKYSRLDVLINNAGGVFDKRITTVDGLEMNFDFNHIGYFLLTNLLLDVIKASAPARIINVSSRAHYRGKINFDDLQSDKNYSMFGAYSDSKLANVLFTYELARRLEGTGVTVNCLHPGGVRSNFAKNTKFRFFIPFAYPFMISSKKGAETSVYLATSPEVEGVTGKYFSKKKAKKSSDLSYDEDLQKRLWDESLKLAGIA